MWFGSATGKATESSEKFHGQNTSVALVKKMECQYYLPLSKVTLSSVEGAHCEQAISVFEVEGISESGDCKNMGLQLENHISSKTSAPTVSLNLKNPLDMKKFEKIFNECDIPELSRGSVKRSINNSADKSRQSQGKYDGENLNSSSDSVTQVSETCQIEKRITKENLSMHRQLSGVSTYTFCTTGAIKASDVEFDTVGNAASQDVQYEREQIHEKIYSQESSVENTQMFKSHNSNSLVLEEELGGKQGHTINKAALNEYLESSDIHLQTPPKLQAVKTVEQPKSVTPENSTESVEINQNLYDIQLESMSIPDEMEFSIIKDVSCETDESYEKLVRGVTMADECIREKVFMMSNECAMLGNNQLIESNSKDRTSLPQELQNGISLNEAVERGQKTNPDGTSVKSFSKQMHEQNESKKLRNDTDKDVSIASVEKQIKEAELRLVINC